ncbi:putative glycerophosphocholine phosphodiesterase GPCPD1 homolog 2 [Episyrphus balteatus]|uniref:putative glycerophosphocholine phosphodiesterase GPCPD1 homolog 2 n=1 Tax=Episyrphus balteatus TaxID=286459 RepID=UPI0024852B8C|nr:putative glycerophosphocholine phosphodiesterase GPCPD1 homolog 2 [Episyrphus balteatus]
MFANKIILISLIALVAKSKALNLGAIQNSISRRWTVIVELEEPLKSYEKVGITGDAAFLGSWSTSRTIMLNKTESPTKWMGSIKIPTNFKSSIMYRFFIGMANSTGGELRIHKWETHLDGRTANFKSGKKSLETTDRFGYVGDVKKVNQGWLNSGRIVQLNIFKDPLKLKRSYGDRKMFIKVTPVGYDSISYNADQKLQSYNESLGLAHIEYVRVEYGNSKIRVQPDDGVSYEKDGHLIFHITTGDLKYIAFNFTITAENEEDPEKKDLIAYQYIYPENIDSTSGNFHFNLISPVNNRDLAGFIKLGYLVIKPLPTPLNFKNAFNNYWPKSWKNLDALHRGVGQSFGTAENAAPVTENTIKTMKEALIQGADMVEFDVQLTKNNQLMIYHDYVTYTSKKGKKPTKKEDLTKVFIADTTYEELKNLETYHFVNEELVKYPTHNEETDEDKRLFPSFEDLLTKVNKNLSYDIEIKQPLYHSFDKNEYVDIILDVMLRKGCGRLSIFSSINTDLLTLIQFKQNMHPVMLIGYAENSGFADPRSNNLKNMISGAQGMEWLGVLPHSSYFLYDKGDLIKLATDLNVEIIPWGVPETKDMVDYFKKFKPTAVMYGRGDEIIPDSKKKNFFESQKDMPEYYEKHCACRNVTDEYVN